MTRRSGLVLLVVAGILGVMATLGVAFVTMAHLERKASQQRFYATQALLLARSGIEDALARLGAGQDPSTPENAYAGENWDASVDGLLSPFEAAQQVYRATPAGTRADTDACPACHALRPSFCAADALGAARLVGVDGRQRGYSGILSGDSVIRRSTYALKLKTGGIHLNGGDPSQAPTEGYNAVLRRMLGALAESLDREDGVDDATPLNQTDGEALVDRRPKTGWESWEQAGELAFPSDPPSLRQAKLEALRPYLTLSSWVDKKVIRPNAQAGMEGQACLSWAEIKLAHETYPTQPGTREPDFERIPVLPAGKLVGRAPVDLGWARTRRPVLIALLAGLKGLYLDESTASCLDGGDAIGTIQSAEIGLSWAGADDCRLAADRLLACTSELRTWDQWDAFCDSIPFSGTSDLRQAKRDILKANFNPNSRLNKFSPNAACWRSVDKSDLLAYSTEFSLLPQAAPQELESAGRVVGKDGRLLAGRQLRASIAPAGLVTLSTQKEFACEELGDPAVAGDERAFRLPGCTSPFLAESQGAGGKTWGHSLDMTARFPGSWMNGSSAGAALQTYPEPCVDSGSGLSLRPADYDGSVQLATVETPDNDTYGVTNCAPNDMKLLARYTAGLDLDVSDAAPAKGAGDPRWRNQPDLEQVTTAELGNGLWHGAKPNTLYPDGAYSEKDRAPSYLDQGNANGFQGVLSFWIKSNHLAPLDTTYRGHPFLKWSNYVEGYAGEGASLDQFFFLGDTVVDFVAGAPPNVTLYPILCQFETAHDTADDKKEHRFQRDRALTPHRWSLITMYYDFRSPTKNDSGELRVDAGLAAVDQGSNDKYPFSAGNDPGSAADITVPDLFGDHRLILGKGQPEIEHMMTSYTGSGADATFDELAIYDFGGAGPGGIPAAGANTLASPALLASNRFTEGRYYRESVYLGLTAAPGSNRAAGYFSPPIRLGSLIRIKALAWTQVLPRGLKAPLPAGGQAGVDGDPGPDGAVLLELADLTGGVYLKDARLQAIDRIFASPAASRVDRLVAVPFRIHAVFQPNLSDKDNTPLLDPLALDDITVVYEAPGGRRVLAWGPGE